MRWNGGNSQTLQFWDFVSSVFVHSIPKRLCTHKTALCVYIDPCLCIFPHSWHTHSPHLSKLSSVLMVEPREPYRTHHMLLLVISSLTASLLTLYLNGNVKHQRQPDASCTLTHVQINTYTCAYINSHVCRNKICCTHTVCICTYTDTCSTLLHALSMAWSHDK